MQITVLSLAVLTICTIAAGQTTQTTPTTAERLAQREEAFRRDFARLPKTLKFVQDVDYWGDGSPAHRLDLYLPTDRPGPFPVLVHIHGGSWRGGDKKAGVTFGHLVEHGIAVASIAYRFSPEAKFPAQIHDCKAAIRFLRAKAKDYNLDPLRFAAIGTSAGGHLAALVGTSGGVAELEGEGPWRDQNSGVLAVVNICGPTDFINWVNKETPDKDWLDASSPAGMLLGGASKDKPELARLVGPITHLDASDPPMLLLHGTKDAIVPVEMMDRFYDALTKLGVPAMYLRVTNAPHGVLNSHPRNHDFITRFLLERLTAATGGKAMRTPLAEKVELEAVSATRPATVGN